MARWLRFMNDGQIGFGTLEDDETISVHQGDMFAGPTPIGQRLPLADVRVLTPTEPGKMIALWNNFHALADKLNQARPEHPLYFLKAANSFLPTGQAIQRPKSYTGKIVYEGELGIVIGRRCADVSEDEAQTGIFGYTCINDVTAIDLLNADPSFAQWVRAKSFDTFGVFGPVVATGIAPETLTVRTVLNGQERQNYPVSDMIIPPRLLVSLLSRDMTLMPGDVICCGTSVGVGTMKEARNLIEVTIDGIGTLSNVFEQQPSERPAS
jgi:2-keto-4-pentenoate hydratase/2-oxohepta-3-ene-1,7-dioic acid hydratase in catechol pathway